MVELNKLAEKVFALLKGNGLQIKIFDEEGTEITDPALGRRFFVTNPNIMVTIDEDSNSIEFSKGGSTNTSVDNIQKNIRKLGDEFLMNSKIKVFGKSIQPRDYAFRAKTSKASPVMENVNAHLRGEILRILGDAGDSFTSADMLYRSIRGSNFADVQATINDLISTKEVETVPGMQTRDKKPFYKVKIDKPSRIQQMTKAIKTGRLGEAADIQPVNHLLIGEIIKLIKRWGGSMHESDLLSNLDDQVDLSEIRPVLNHLVQTNKLTTQPDKHGYPVYSIKMDEAVYEAEVNKRKDGIKESFSKMFGSQKLSQQTLENVRILVKHKTPIDENVRGSRTRQISAIFLECNEERFRFPHNHLAGARAMAQHMAHGGTMSDKVGSYIIENVSNLAKLKSFNRYVITNNLINEDSSGIVDTVKENIDTIRLELKKLTGVKTYETARARLETFEREALSEDDTSQLKDLFTIRRFDEKFEEVLPIVKQLVQEKNTFFKRIEEAAANNIILRRGVIKTTPMFEFASEHARLGFRLNEFALRIKENDELAGFVNKIGTKMCKEGIIDDFERAVLTQVLENAKLEQILPTTKPDIKESKDYASYIGTFVVSFY